MDVRNVDLAEASESGLYVYSLGYEPRCTHVAQVFDQSNRSESVSIGYSHSRVHAYEEARAIFNKLQVPVLDEVTDAGYREVVVGLLRNRKESGAICIDISSMNRDRIATWVECIRSVSAERPITTHFLYSPSTFVLPSSEIVQNESIGPVTAAFSGRLDSHLPAELLLGLGYEVGKALGALEYLQCPAWWLFVPRSAETQFESEVCRVNALLLSQTPKERILHYQLEDPAGTYSDICSLLRGVSQRASPLLLPLGPKLFSLLSMLAGVEFENTSVWRASQGTFEVPIRREASGPILGVSTEILSGAT